MMYTRNTYYSDYCDRPSCVYRIFDIENALLYVGLSTNPDSRLAEHRRRQPWRDKIARQDVQWYPDRETAKSAERQAIRDEDPLFNIARPKVVAT